MGFHGCAIELNTVQARSCCWAVLVLLILGCSAPAMHQAPGRQLPKKSCLLLAKRGAICMQVGFSPEKINASWTSGSGAGAGTVLHYICVCATLCRAEALLRAARQL